MIAFCHFLPCYIEESHTDVILNYLILIKYFLFFFIFWVVFYIGYNFICFGCFGAVDESSCFLLPHGLNQTTLDIRTRFTARGN